MYFHEKDHQKVEFRKEGNIKMDELKKAIKKIKENKLNDLDIELLHKLYKIKDYEKIKADEELFPKENKVKSRLSLDTLIYMITKGLIKGEEVEGRLIFHENKAMETVLANYMKRIERQKKVVEEFKKKEEKPDQEWGALVESLVTESRERLRKQRIMELGNKEKKRSLFE